MNITDIKVRRLLQEGRLRAVVSVTVDDEIAIHDIKVINTIPIPIAKTICNVRLLANICFTYSKLPFPQW